MRDLSDIRDAYERGEGSLRVLAERFSVPLDTIKKRAAKEKWHQAAGSEDAGGSTEEAVSAKSAIPETAPPPENGTKIGTTEAVGAKSAVPKMAPPPDNGTKSGTAGAIGAKSAIPKMAPVPESGTENGTNEATGAKSGTTGRNGTAPTIPADINSYDKLTAARFYHGTLRWAVHPLYSPDRGDENQRGKKPINTGWRKHAAFEVTPDMIDRWFGPGRPDNLGCVVRPPFVHVDLDSKPDGGESVRAWLAGQPELAAVPRERTGGGAHLVFTCHDLPDEVRKLKQAPAVRINDAVMAELYFDAQNIVLSPSVHKSGHTYRWEVTGAIPEVKWEDLCRWFGFAAPEERKRGRPPKGKPWWAKWQEDLRTLDLTGAMAELGMLGECVEPEAAKWSVRCPWESEHSAAAKEAPGTDTVIFNPPQTIPAFRCLHSHCEGRTIKDLVEWIESERPGTIARRCTGLRAFLPGTKDGAGRLRVQLPGTGRSHSEFARETGEALGPALDLFHFRGNVAEVRRLEETGGPGGILGDTLHLLHPADLVTAVERTVETGTVAKDETGERIFAPKSMSEADARITLANRTFLRLLPRIDRLLDVPMPYLIDGKLVYPEHGYDPRFRTWLSPDAPRICTMGVDEAISILLDELLARPEDGGFWWHDEQSRTHALARLITPFCRGLMNWRRTPLWIFDGNREGSGKDTCANVTFHLYTGHGFNGAPSAKDGEEELRKRITSALLAGDRFFHLANMKGHIRFACLEAATDNSGVWEDRMLGVSRSLTLPNETEFSISANNATWEPDIERRCRRIRLSFSPEDVNGHRYLHTDLVGWIVERRSRLLSAINALVVNWVRVGCPSGRTPFTSFPQWGETMGGICAANGLPDPCLPHEDTRSSGDQATQAMRQFFALAFERFGDREVLKKEFQEFVQQTEDVHDLFDWIDFAARRGQTMFGKLVGKFDCREMGGITLRIRQTSKNRADYRFFRQADQLVQSVNTPSPAPAAPSEAGTWGHWGTFSTRVIGPNKSEEKIGEHDALNGAYRTGGKMSPDVPTSPLPLVHTSRASLERIAADLADASTIALDIETYGPAKGDALDPWRGDIRLLTLCRHAGTIHTIDLRATGYDLGPLKGVLEGAELIAHNARFDLLWLRVKCGLMARRVTCTLTAARLLAAGTKPGNNLDQCLERHLGIAPAADHSRSDWGAMLLTDDQLAYAARDVAHLHDLAGAMAVEIEAAGLDDVWALERELLPCVIDMEAAGVPVDRERLAAIRDSSREAAGKASDELRAALGAPGLNPASPAQLLAALRAAGLTLESTAEEALKAADDGRLVPLVLSMREAEKRAQQAEALIGHIQQDGRIHARFEPTGTATGRFSSKDPNLQNIGRGELRGAFAAPAGRMLVVADYSQIELRAAAAIAGESRMIDAYKAGADLHRLTAATVLDKPESDVTKADRQLSKAVNFGLLYGQSAAGLVRYAASSYGITLTGEQAQAIRAAFFRTYARLRQWHGLSRQQAEAGATEVRTRTGRRRLIPASASEWERFTALVNTPVQGGTADGMKQAIIDVSNRLPAGATIVLTVHDELVVECDAADAETVRAALTESMTAAMAALFPEVPVEVEAGVCTTWAEK